jgi:hypothetical protein
MSKRNIESFEELCYIFWQHTGAYLVKIWPFQKKKEKIVKT